MTTHRLNHLLSTSNRNFCRPLISRLAMTVLLVAMLNPVHGEPLGSSFTYQGELTVDNSPANGTFDLEFELYDALADGDSLSTRLIIDNVSVSDGVFSVELDFGPDPFFGEQLWIEIGVRNGTSNGGFQGLAPRQKMTSVPFAQHAETIAANAIAGAEIANNSISASDIGSNAVGASELSNNAVDTGALQAAAVTASKLAGNAVSSVNIVDGSVGAADIDVNQVQRRINGSCAEGTWVASVSSSGNVTCTTRPTPIVFKVGGNGFAVKDLDANQTIEADIWPIRAIDTRNAFNTTTDRYVIPESGYYYLHAVIRQSNAVTTSFFRISFNVDTGIDYTQIQDEDDSKLDVSGIYFLSAGREVFVNVRNFGPADVRVDGTGSWFEGYRIR